jgi:hypothetical protein
VVIVVDSIDKVDTTRMIATIIIITTIKMIVITTTAEEEEEETTTITMVMILKMKHSNWLTQVKQPPQNDLYHPRRNDEHILLGYDKSMPGDSNKAVLHSRPFRNKKDLVDEEVVVLLLEVVVVEVVVAVEAEVEVVEVITTIASIVNHLWLSNLIGLR